MVIKVLRLDSLLKKIEDISNIDVTEVIKNGTLEVQAEAKKLAPVNKILNAPTRGNLRNSIKASLVNAGKPNVFGRVHTNVEYALYQEFGTVKMKAQPFLRPALKRKSRAIRKEMAEFVKEDIKKKI